MEDWWDSIASLGQDALVWLLGLATHGGTYRDKPPTLGAGKTSNYSHEVGKANAYAKLHNLEFDPKEGYQRLRSVDVSSPKGKTSPILTQAKGGGHMQLSRPVGIAVFHHICGNDDLRDYLEGQLFESGGNDGDPVFQPHEDAHIAMQATITGEEDVYRVEARFTCLRSGCGATVEHTFSLHPHAEANHEHAPYAYVQVACPECKLGHRHFRRHPWCRPEVAE